MPLTSTIIKPPNLPAEVWFAIFELATFVPNAFDIHAPDPFDYPGPWTQEQIQEAIRTTMPTKRHLVLVCRTWYMLASRYLYRSIPIFRPGTLKKLLRSLNSDVRNESSLGASSAEESKTWWTIRLDFSLRCANILVTSDLVVLLRRLSNLQIIVFRRDFPASFYSGEATSCFRVLQTCPSRSLHVVDIACDYISSRPLSDLPESITHPSIRVLNIKTSPRSTIQNFVFPDNVQHLDIPRKLLGSVLAIRPFPTSLSHISLDVPTSSMTDLLKALSIQGHRLTSLEVNVSHFFLDEPGIVALTQSLVDLKLNRSFDEFFRIVASVCPNLRNLIINHTRIFPEQTHYLPPIEKLGIRNNPKRDTIRLTRKKHWKGICQNLDLLIAATPSLKVIRSIDRPSLYELAKNRTEIHKILSRYSEKFFRKYGVRFEDCTGQLFHSDVVVTVSIDKTNNKKRTPSSGDESLFLGPLKELSIN